METAVFTNRLKRWLPFLIILVLLAVVAVSGSIYWQKMFIFATIYAIWTSSWNILGGYAGQFSMGHAAYVGIGAYVTGLLYNNFGITPWVGVIIAGLFAGIVGMLIGMPCFRLKGSYFVLSTVAILSIIRTLVKTIKNIGPIKIGGGTGITIKWGGTVGSMQSNNNVVTLLMALFILIIVLIVSDWVRNSKLGYSMFAVNNDQDAADSLGVNVMMSKTKAMFLSAFFTAVGGGLYVMTTTYMDPDTVFPYALSVNIMTFTVIGGRGTLWGPVFGAMLMYPLNEIMRVAWGASASGLSNVIFGVVLMVVILFLPKGLYGSIENIVLERKEKKRLDRLKAAAEAEKVEESV